MLEFKHIVDERRDELGTLFVSVTTYFWTKPHRRDSVGALLADVTSPKYTLANGTSFFMSKKTAQSLGDNIISSTIYLSYL